MFFISNDLKADWVYQNGEHKDKPLTELLAEFQEESGQKIWMYSTISFIEQLSVSIKILKRFHCLTNKKM